MKQTFTQETLLLYLYDELSSEDRTSVKEALSNDSQLRIDLDELKETLKMIDIAKPSPSQRSIDHILNYSKSLHVYSSNDLGPFEGNKN